MARQQSQGYDPSGALTRTVAALERASQVHGDLTEAILPVAAVEKATAGLRKWGRSRRGVDRDEVPALAEMFRRALRLVHDLAQRPAVAASLVGPLQGLHRALHELGARADVAARLHGYRQGQGLSLQDVADQVGLGQPYMGQLERMAVGLPSHEAAQLVFELIGDPAALDVGTGTAGPATPGDADRARAMALLKKRVAHLPAADVEVLADVAAALAGRRR